MSKGLLWGALGGAAQAGTEIVNRQIQRRDATQDAQAQAQTRRAAILEEMAIKNEWARSAAQQERADRTEAVQGRLTAGADAALERRYAEPVEGDTPLTPEQQAVQTEGLSRMERDKARDRASYESDPRNRLRASVEAGFSDPEKLADLDSREQVSQARLESQEQVAQARIDSQQELGRVRAQADVDKRMGQIDVTMARLDSRERARVPTGFRNTPDGNMEPIPGGPADQKVLAAFRDDTTQLAGSTDGLNRLAVVANTVLRHPGLPGITGLQGKIPNFPGGDAADAAAQLETLKSQIGFGVLQAMRDASATGGALGAVSDAEGKRLEANLAALAQTQSLDQFKASLTQVIDYAEGAKGRLRDAFNLKHGSRGTPASDWRTPPAGDGRPPRISSPEQLADLPSGTVFQAPDGSLRTKP
jgi:hypothetical protein